MPYKNLPEADWDRMDRCVEKVQGQGHDKQGAIAICYTSISGKEYTPDIQIEPVGAQFRVFDANSGETLKQVDSAREAAIAAKELFNAQDMRAKGLAVMAHGAGGLMSAPGLEEDEKATAEVNDLPDSAFLYVESGGEKDDGGKTVPRSLRHLPYRTPSGAVDLPHLRNALSRLGQGGTGESGGERWLTAGVRDTLRKKAEKILADNTDAESAKKETQVSIFERVLSALRGDTKEGKRNSNTDAGRLQQIHDLSVANGAECPMVFKQADGRYRWILFSSNAYQDRDKEIIKQKALEDDVARTDSLKATGKATGGDYGPLRWWHMGAPDPIARTPGPGADIGTCDFRAMSGRVLIESGTFVNERIGAAIKESASDLAGSIGFFHPTSEPDSEGVYHSILVFERSLLPRNKASNPLTALTVTKGDQDMATSKEKTDQLIALLGDQKLAEAVIQQAEQTEKAADDRGLKYKQDNSDELAAATDKAKSGVEGSPEEEKTEPKKEAEAEGDTPDYAAMAKALAPHLMKMVEEKMAAARKEQTDKEAGFTAQITALEAQVKELYGDLPRGIRSGFRASQSEATILKDIQFKDTQHGDALDSVVDQLMGVKR